VFLLAYSAFEIPSGWLGDVFGPRKTLIRIVLWWSFFTALTGLVWPVAGWPLFGFWALIVIRFCFGVGEAGAYPNIARAFHNWFPFTERGFSQGAVWMSGRFMGGVTPYLVNSILIVAVATDGTQTIYWRHTFWIFGGLGVVWCVVWWLLFRDRPEQSRAVNTGELALIQAGKQVADGGHHRGVPWKRFVTSGNLWVLCFAYFCSSYGWYFNMFWLPKYLKEVYGIDKVAEPFRAGLLTGSPLLFGAIACVAGGYLSDAFIRRTGNRKWGRRLFGVVGKGICGLCYVGAIFAPNVYWFVLAVAMGAFWNDMTMGAAWASCLDIGRKYSGIISGCMNTIGNLGGTTATILTGQILSRFAESVIDPATGSSVVDHTVAWQINLASFAAVYFVAVLLWCNFDSTKELVDED